MLSAFSPWLIIVGLLAVVAIAFLFKGVVMVRQSEVIVVERLGSFNRLLEHGLGFVIPFLEQRRNLTLLRYDRQGEVFVPKVTQVERIDRREQLMDFPGQPVVTQDNVTVQINGALYYQIIDPRSAVYEIENVSQAIEVLAKTTMRSEVGRMELDSIFSSRAELNAKIQEQMETAADKWGIKITRVEVQDIHMPAEIEESMRQQMAAERRRRAAVTDARGDKEAAITRAEGEKEAQILRATGDKEALKLVTGAVGDSEADKRVAINYLIAREYIQQLPHIAQDGERVIVPYEATALMGTVGGMKDLFNPQSGTPSGLGAGILGGEAASTTPSAPDTGSTATSTT